MITLSLVSSCHDLDIGMFMMDLRPVLGRCRQLMCACSGKEACTPELGSQPGAAKGST